MTELMPCPFCGLAPRVIEDTQGHDFQIFCVCEAEPGFSVPKADRERAITAWNTRPAPSPSREGWLDEKAIQYWAKGDSDRLVAGAELRALCDMALSALRPAGDEGDGEEPKVVIPTTFKGNTTTVTADYGLILPTYAAGSLSFLEGYDTRVVKLSDAEAAIFKAALHTETKPTTKPKEDK